MKTRLQAISMVLLMAIFAVAPMSASAHGNGKKKGHHKKHYHQKHVGPPSWAPAHGYRAKYRQEPVVRYIYNPEYNIYYDRIEGVYLYMRRGRLVMSAQLPINLNGRNVRDGFNVMLSYANDCHSMNDFISLERNRRGERFAVSYSRYR